MITARIEFKPGLGGHFCPSESQSVIEVEFESVPALIEVLREFEDAIFNCTVQVNGKIVDLRNISGLYAPA